MSEEIRTLKEILNNNDLDNYTIDDDECYLNGYTRKCLKKVLEEIERLHSIIKEVRDYIKDYELYYDEELGLVEMMGAGSTRTPVIESTPLLEILDKVEEK